MTVTLNFKPETEAELLAQASGKGVTIENHLLSMLESAVLVAPALLSANERADAFEAWSRNHKPTQLLSDYAVSRASMYDGNGK